MKARQMNMPLLEPRNQLLKLSYALQEPSEFHLNTEAQ